MSKTSNVPTPKFPNSSDKVTLTNHAQTQVNYTRNWQVR